MSSTHGSLRHHRIIILMMISPTLPVHMRMMLMRVLTSDHPSHSKTGLSAARPQAQAQAHVAASSVRCGCHDREHVRVRS